MSERKVLNKYYPPDFDASKIPKLHLPRDRQYVVRLMAPFNMRCTTCGEYIYKGKKFNARKETVQNETYLGLLIFRFYIRCPRCISEITFKTDPENTDYVCEQGATRNFQAHKLMEEQEKQQQQEREEEELNNPMKALENRTRESKQEMDILEKLEELRDLNSRQANVDFSSLIEMTTKEAEEQQARQEKQDEDLVKSIFGPKSIQKRLSDDESGDEDTAVGSGTKTRGAATDVLTEEVEEALQQKLKRSWEQSVGKLSKKSSLSSLVKIKKPKGNSETPSTVTKQSTSQDSNIAQKTSTISKKCVSGGNDSIPGSACGSSDSASGPKNTAQDTGSAQEKAGHTSLSLLGNYSSSGDDSD